jgi:hypothetical protein
MDVERLARALGWFGIVLGTTELMASRLCCRTLGVGDQSRLVQMYGLRGITAGLGILTQREAGYWMRTRVAGDALDLSTLIVGSHRTRRPKALGAALVGIAAVAAADLACGKALQEREVSAA